MTNPILKEIEEQEKTSYRNGENVAKCEACGRLVDLNIERIYYYARSICSTCYAEVREYLK